METNQYYHNTHHYWDFISKKCSDLETVKFINFHYSSFLDPFFDIAFFLLNTGLGNYQTIEENFLREYLNFHENMDMSLESSLEKLDKYKNFCYRLAIHRLSADLVFELSLHGNKRSNRIIKLIKTYEYLRPYIEKHHPQYSVYSDDFFYLIK